jgi:hypothetical protein
MRAFLFALVLLAGGYWAGQNQPRLKSWWQNVESQTEGYFEKRTETPPEEPVVEPLPPPLVFESPTTPVTPSAPASTPLPELPEGIYFTKERISLVTDSGVRAIAAGVKVNKIGEQEGRYLIDDGRNKLMADPWQVTRDPAAVQALKK